MAAKWLHKIAAPLPSLAGWLVLIGNLLNWLKTAGVIAESFVPTRWKHLVLPKVPQLLPLKPRWAVDYMADCT